MEGVVLSAGGRPLPGVPVTIAHTTSQEPVAEIAPLTDRQGRFRFTGLPTGRYRFRAGPSGYQPCLREVEVKDGRLSRLRFALKKVVAR